MKRSQLRKIIKECISEVISEAVSDSERQKVESEIETLRGRIESLERKDRQTYDDKTELANLKFQLLKLLQQINPQPDTISVKAKKYFPQFLSQIGKPQKRDSASDSEFYKTRSQAIRNTNMVRIVLSKEEREAQETADILLVRRMISPETFEAMYADIVEKHKSI